MSEDRAEASRADQLRRDRRERWAAPGSRHDRTVRIARIALPAAVGGLAAVLALSPLAKRPEISFVLAKDKVDMAKERMRVTRASYRGQDDKGQAFAVSAGSAVQPTSKVPVVQLNDMAARLNLQDGPATLAAPRARYDMDKARLQVDGPLTVEGAGGYRLETHDVAADLNTRTLSSDSAVAGRIPLGRFTAGSLRADLGTRTVTLGGRARLHIDQGAARARR